MPEISVIIPTFRDWDRLRLCIDALHAQNLPSDRFEVVIANNDAGNPKPPFPLAANIRVVVEGRPGSYAARNAAVATCRGAVLAFTDSDCVPDRDWLASGLRALAATPDARISGQVPIFREASGNHLAYLYEYHTAFRQREYAARGEGATANLMVARATFERVGPFNPDLLSGGDFEWHRRAHETGVPMVYAHDMIVRHPARTRLGDIFRKRRRTARSEAKFHATSTWDYLKYRIKPPVGRFQFDRGAPTRRERALLFATMWSINLYAAGNFALVRAGLAKPVRE